MRMWMKLAELSNWSLQMLMRMLTCMAVFILACLHPKQWIEHSVHFFSQGDRRKINRQVRKGLGAILERGGLGGTRAVCFHSLLLQNPGTQHCMDAKQIHRWATWHFVIWGRLNFSCQVLQDLQQADSGTPSRQSCKNSWPRFFLIQVRNHFVSCWVLSRSFCWSRNNFGAPYPVSRTWRSDKMPSW